jgi:hypothetical protein
MRRRSALALDHASGPCRVGPVRQVARRACEQVNGGFSRACVPSPAEGARPATERPHVIRDGRPNFSHAVTCATRRREPVPMKADNAPWSYHEYRLEKKPRDMSVNQPPPFMSTSFSARPGLKRALAEADRSRWQSTGARGKRTCEVPRQRPRVTFLTGSNKTSVSRST